MSYLGLGLGVTVSICIIIGIGPAIAPGWKIFKASIEKSDKGKYALFLFLWALITIGISTVVVYVITGYVSLHDPFYSKIDGFMHGFLPGVACIVLFLMIVSRLDFFWRLRPLLVVSVIVWILLIVSSAFVIQHVRPRSSSNDSHTFTEWDWGIFYNTPGASYAYILGLVTIIGFSLTISNQVEANARITTYGHLMDRIAFLLNEHMGWQEAGLLWGCLHKMRLFLIGSPPRHLLTTGEGCIRILAHTLALGCISEPALFKRNKALLARLRDSYEWRIIQLDHERSGSAFLDKQGPLFQHFNRFGHGHNGDPRISHAYLAARELGTSFQKESYDNPKEWRNISLNGSPIRFVLPAADIKDVPDYHLIVSNMRALIITCFDLAPHVHSDKKVQVVALETTNREVIDKLLVVFDQVWNGISDSPISDLSSFSDGGGI